MLWTNELGPPPRKNSHAARTERGGRKIRSISSPSNPPSTRAVCRSCIHTYKAHMVFKLASIQRIMVKIHKIWPFSFVLCLVLVRMFCSCHKTSLLSLECPRRNQSFLFYDTFDLWSRTPEYKISPLGPLSWSWQPSVILLWPWQASGDNEESTDGRRHSHAP